MAKFDGFKLAAKAADAKSKIPILNQVRVFGGVAYGNDLDTEICAPTQMADGAYNVKGQPVAKPADFDDYQTLLTPELSAAESVPLGAYDAILSLVASAMSVEETRYYLNGTYCEFKGGLKVTAVDGNRLLHFAAPQSDALNLEPFILPREVAKIIASVKGAWSLKATPTRVEFREQFTGLVIRSKTIDGAFPDYQRVIPKQGFNGSIEGNGKPCLAVVKQCASYGSSRSKSMKVDGSSLTVRADLDDLKPLETTWPVQVKGDPITIGFNVVYVRDMLTVAGADDFVIWLTDSASPVRVDFPQTPGLVGVLMPLRV